MIKFNDTPECRAYHDNNGNPIGEAYYDVDRCEFRFRDHTQTCPWAECAGSPTLAIFDHIALAIHTHMNATGH